MKLKKLALAVGTAAAFSVSGAQAASFVPHQSVTLTPGGSASLFSMFEGPPGARYYELVNNTLSSLKTKVALNDTTVDLEQLTYKVYEDADGSANSVDTSNGSFLTVVLTDSPDETVNPFFNFVMDAGKHYILELTRMSSDLAFARTDISAVPLPGAIWLFGSALLGFLGFSNRRKI